MYLNLYVPPLQRELGVVGFFKHHRSLPFASGAVMQPITDAFVADIHRFADEGGIEFVRFSPASARTTWRRPFVWVKTAEHEGASLEMV
jgi:hypothetical protein